MIVRTCLLITDDPDDYVDFTEAFREVADEMLVLMVSDVERASHMLAQGRCTPEWIFLNTDMNLRRPERLFEVLASVPELGKIRVVAFGGQLDALLSYTGNKLIFAPPDIGYSGLKEFLSQLVK